jgi:hypothetical protein
MDPCFQHSLLHLQLCCVCNLLRHESCGIGEMTRSAQRDEMDLVSLSFSKDTVLDFGGSNPLFTFWFLDGAGLP